MIVLNRCTSVDETYFCRAEKSQDTTAGSGQARMKCESRRLFCMKLIFFSAIVVSPVATSRLKFLDRQLMFFIECFRLCIRNLCTDGRTQRLLRFPLSLIDPSAVALNLTNRLTRPVMMTRSKFVRSTSICACLFASFTFQSAISSGSDAFVSFI